VNVSAARELARSLLAEDLPRRWSHVQGVASRAELFTGNHEQADLIIAAAYLHDIGYATVAMETGFHQLDGGRLLRRLGCDEDLVNLVAQHSGAEKLARYSGIGDVLDAEFPKAEHLPHRELHFCDLTTSLDGRPVTVDERLADIRHRHRANPAMLQFLDANEADLRQMVDGFWTQLGLGADQAAIG
jgi:putative nucleotidyltransferase with HDIG domain